MQEQFGIRALPDGQLWRELPKFCWQASLRQHRGDRHQARQIVRTLAAYPWVYRFVCTPAAREQYRHACSQPGRNAGVSLTLSL